MRLRFLLLTVIALASGATTLHAAEAKKQVLLIAGRPSHNPGEHEHNAGMLLLKKCLDESGLPVETKVHLNATWPSAEELAKADTIVCYSDGSTGHFLLKDDRLEQLGEQIRRGVGFACLHYAVEYPLGRGGSQALDWLGGFFESKWSVNPHWQADFKELPQHPVSNGVKPFSTNDEWYFHLRFRGDNQGKLTPILSAIPPESTMSRRDGDRSGNPTVRAEVAAKKPQTVAWTYERLDTGRSFGFTGGHFHSGWGHDDQRKLVLNGILWTAKAELPADGVQSKVTPEELAANLDPKPKKEPRPAIASPTPNPPNPNP
ncbi:MAG TPA: ThuA domain-containing protein [Chthoniobacteraceae bacterium]|jgi:type 1 glutamine amidotransferase